MSRVKYGRNFKAKCTWLISSARKMKVFLQICTSVRKTFLCYFSFWNGMMIATVLIFHSIEKFLWLVRYFFKTSEFLVRTISCNGFWDTNNASWSKFQNTSDFNARHFWWNISLMGLPYEFFFDNLQRKTKLGRLLLFLVGNLFSPKFFWGFATE